VIGSSLKYGRELRTPASGVLEILFENPDLVVIPVQLVERSCQGLRMAHNSPELIAGLEIKIREGGSLTRARVVWTHLLEGRRVSGCVIFAGPLA
jgi:hypothetical protein